MTTDIISEHQTLKRDDGRVLGFAEYGDPDGVVVLGFHGVPGTRFMFRPTAAAAKRLGMRIVAPDRPGYGLSEPMPGRQLADWLDDVAALLKHLAIDTFSLVGISGGGPFATITAAHFGDRVKALGLVSPMGPVADVYNSIEMSKLQQRLFLQLPSQERLVKWGASGANAVFRMAPGPSYDLAIRTLPPADREIMQQPQTKAHVIQDVQESLTFDGAGAQSDLVIFSQPWGVDYSCITARAVLWQGLDDTIVPIGAALALGRLIPGCKIVELDGEGHFWGLREVDEILERVKSLAAL
ncbi:MAG: pimeloyl-ACP methyl ester carboxylesterase [Hyphomicrobiaceae bacterium]|jgi:pimeloyl-ACP methyl ester carboxylesterase